MTATYYERFYPRDMDGVVAYVAPTYVVNKEDSAYDRFFATSSAPRIAVTG
ncbi:Tripeptidyl aminopeptidase OS=Streptomyces fumanus OX=67302 GN=GCM10018772_06250 PE=4 SV=1 [Streptomyces fumanus]